MTFEKKKGMSYVLTKRIADCTPEERDYKRAYARHLKTRMVERIGRENYHEYNSNYGKQYYQLHREKLSALARERKAAARGSRPSLGRGRPSALGIATAPRATAPRAT